MPFLHNYTCYLEIHIYIIDSSKFKDINKSPQSFPSNHSPLFIYPKKSILHPVRTSAPITLQFQSFLYFPFLSRLLLLLLCCIEILQVCPSAIRSNHQLVRSRYSAEPLLRCLRYSRYLRSFTAC